LLKLHEEAAQCALAGAGSDPAGAMNSLNPVIKLKPKSPTVS
jgi:hypothetical protein